jgi:hypothetical protein
MPGTALRTLHPYKDTITGPILQMRTLRHTDRIRSLPWISQEVEQPEFKQGCSDCRLQIHNHYTASKFLLRILYNYYTKQ